MSAYTRNSCEKEPRPCARPRNRGSEDELAGKLQDARILVCRRNLTEV